MNDRPLPLIARDHYVPDTLALRRERYDRPVRGLVKSALRVFEIIATRRLPQLAGPLRDARLRRERAYARPVPEPAAGSYLRGPAYLELQIGKETRPVFVLAPGATIAIPYLPEANEDLVFGVAPIVEPHQWSRGVRWGWEVGCGEAPDNAQQFVTRVPCVGRDDNFVYFPGDGWIDVKLSLDERAGRPSVIVFRNPETASAALPVTIGAPQVLRRRGAGQARNIVVLSIESLTAPAFLRQRYGDIELPHLSAFADEAVEYPLVYTATDATLPYAGCVLTGLMPSQHGIGDYGIGADTFLNRVANRRLPMLQEVLKRQRFLTFAAAGAGRFSGKVGWARGFDIFLHEYHKWSDDAAVGFEAVARTFRKFKHYDKFYFTHIDYLHDPLVCAGAAQGRATLFPQQPLAVREEGISPALYFQQLALVDQQFGQLIQSLKSDGTYDNTGIILTGDHGCGLNWIKHSHFSLYDERLRVPLIIKPPSWAAAQPAVPAVSSSISEIFRTIHSWLGMPLDSALAALPQYRQTGEAVAMAETIMNPNREYRRHCLAVMRPPFKYVCWNRIDWDAHAVEEFGEERLFRSMQSSADFDESADCAAEHPGVAAELRAFARATIAENLDFHRSFPPEPY